ncbi:helix-turn-helix transcriptional regulator [Cytobacillus horneckiae]|uniref:helix-turn-helix domain-containing protein n=1 Tax=Cytobacillus horneckiae TaxID=549687 RepID=UPI0039A1E16E
MIGNLATNLCILRHTKNLTQKEVAKKLCISEAKLSWYERNITVPNEEMLKELADFYGVTVQQLTEEDL